MPRELSDQHRRWRSGRVIGISQGMAQMQTRNNMPPAPTVLAADQAPQGVTGHNVRYVLGFGIAGTVICFLIVGFLTTHGLFGALW